MDRIIVAVSKLSTVVSFAALAGVGLVTALAAAGSLDGQATVELQSSAGPGASLHQEPTWIVVGAAVLTLAVMIELTLAVTAVLRRRARVQCTGTASPAAGSTEMPG